MKAKSYAWASIIVTGIGIAVAPTILSTKILCYALLLIGISFVKAMTEE